ncbi:MAG: energy-coupling factor ABC transporter ATP-binding protein [Dehalococcoidia bacterium]|nr:energy-coupling factor ABC transporter ATP-binding protein [Dehalococcoidia bacterium]
MALLEAKNLYYRYPNGFEAIDDLDIQINRGDFIGILGPNGGGKTTLLRLFGGLIKPTGGVALLEGIEIGKWKSRDLYRKIGFVFQDPNDQLFANTVAQDVSFGPQNMGLSPEQIEERLAKTLRVVGMEKLRDRPIQELSFGQKRRVALAGVLAMEPEIVFLDEPTSGLDPDSVINAMHLFSSLNKQHKTTMILATHDVDLAYLYTSKIFLLDRGKITISGPPGSIFKQVELIKRSHLKLPHLYHASMIGAICGSTGKIPITLEHIPAENVHYFDQPVVDLPDILSSAAGARSSADLLFRGEKTDRVEFRSPSGTDYSIMIAASGCENGLAWSKSHYDQSSPLIISARETETPGIYIHREGTLLSDPFFCQVIGDAVTPVVPRNRGLQIDITKHHAGQ